MATTSKAALEQLAAAVNELRAQVAALSARVAGLEQPAVISGVKAAPPVASAPPAEEPITQEVLLAISAAVAAYLGKRARVRAVRLLGSTRWSQEGRVSIQASHRLDRV